MDQVAFSEVEIGSFFMPKLDGNWHLKINETHGAYQQWGTRYEPPFASAELVFVESHPSTGNK